ncbi:MAG: glycosyltransferase [Candidatus Marinimicrobia bacterium]|nr:glycosyltransferase [Candidatus Neomarinimicrobiota bacterium]MCF7827961.1 glycosyltransferase [Candidatus Neomarinimicrobiota bacterium]MCF7879284.1 glycosyltransferase [Candidatus Neomarinimicrobiota bacterium]
MDIAVVIPVYNRPDKVQRALNSVLNQTYPPKEILVTDDGSTDGTTAVLEKYHQSNPDLIRVFTHPDNNGVSTARNTAIKNSESRWIALLDSDDEWMPEKLERQVKYHKVHPELEVSQCNEIWVRNGKRVNKRDIHRKKGGRIFTESLKLCLVSPSAAVIHRPIFDEIGYFDESMPACEDYDFWLRVLVHYPIGLLDEPLLTRYGGHQDQLSAQYWGMDRWRVQAMEKHADKDLPVEWKRALYKELIEKLEILHQGAEKRDKPVAEEYQRKIERYGQRLKNITR